ncbi:hypothetical protein [Pandoravirus japonicus]|uniref:Uncharacterized protein n=1 Tax=Pandoravirus japonicus TaxID=2823154 RepID=A0A811BQW6_9VIRU|nr:hypothetical protein [Pandoravirus japonicus]
MAAPVNAMMGALAKEKRNKSTHTGAPTWLALFQKDCFPFSFALLLAVQPSRATGTAANPLFFPINSDGLARRIRPAKAGKHQATAQRDRSVGIKEKKRKR